MPKQLTTKDATRFLELELTITEGLDSFWATCAALAEIREKRWYKKTHARFGDYCVEVLGFSASRARQFGALTGVKVAKSAEKAEPGELVLPEGVEFRKAHRAELARLPAQERQGALDRAVDIAEKAMPSDAKVPRLTAKIIQEAAAAEVVDTAQEPGVPEQAFIDRPLYIAIENQLSAIKRELIKLSKRTSAKFMPLDPLVASFRDIHAGIKHGMPHCWCTDCGGGLDEREDCGTCKGLGFNSLTMFNQADKGQQEGARLWNSATTK